MTAAGQQRAPEYDYTYTWGPTPWLAVSLDRKGQKCRILVQGLGTAVQVEFEDGFQAVVSRHALRRVQP